MEQRAASMLFAKVLLALLALSVLALFAIYWHVYGYDKLFGDYLTFRAASVHLKAGNLPAIYDLARARQAVEGSTPKDFDFFLNPPTGLFFVWPLAFFTPQSGLIFWIGAQLALLWTLLRGTYMQRLCAAKDPGQTATHLLLAVTFFAFTLQNLLFGQLATFCAVLFLAVIAFREDRPVLAGIALGLFSFKPQLGLLLPLLLLAEKRWKLLLIAVITAALMAAASYALWGGGLWRDYSEMVTLRSRYMTEAPDLLMMLSTSVYSAARLVGIEAQHALILQAAVALVVLVGVWLALRKGQESHKILTLVFATYLVTPYSLMYDMVLIALPCAWLLRQAEADEVTRSQLILLVFLILMPVAALLLQILHVPYSIIAIGFGFIVARTLAHKGKDNGVVSA